MGGVGREIYWPGKGEFKPFFKTPYKTPQKRAGKTTPLYKKISVGGKKALGGNRGSKKTGGGGSPNFLHL